MNRTVTVTTALAVSAALALGPVAAHASEYAIANPSFEDDAIGSTTAVGWTFLTDFVDLGTTVLGDCTSVDTSDYTTLRDYVTEAEPAWDIYATPISGMTNYYYVLSAEGASLSVLGMPLAYDENDWFDYTLEDNSTTPASYIGRASWTPEQETAFQALRAENLPDPVAAADDITVADFGSSSFGAQIVDAADHGRTGNILELRSELSGPDGHVAHGPAAVSDPFTIGPGGDVTVDWKSSGDEDDFHVLAYVVNTETCEQLEILDATGEFADWTTTSAALPGAGTYRFVFVAGTYDQSWGGASGALLYVDNITETAAAADAGSELAATGSGDTLVIAVFAGLLTLTGAAAVSLARRRSTAPVDPSQP